MKMIGSKCERCGANATSTTMSMYDQSTICIDCKQDEKQLPSYQSAHDADCRAIRSGDYNFPGIGLGPKDRTRLAEMRKSRVRN